MIELQNVTLRRGGTVLVEEASARIHAGWRVGLTGRNGCGKSSLLAMLAGELGADRGECRVPADWRVATMAQEVPALQQAAADYVLDGNVALRAAEQRLREAEAGGDGMAIARAHEALDALDAWRQPARVAEVLAGLGFAESARTRPVASFSGGWRMRLNLARVLLADADLMLLDEPTNHLDLDAVLWLEEWLRQASATLVLISHDRSFLDSVAGHILHIENRRLTLYSGNYSAFEAQRAARLAQQEQLRAQQLARAAHLQAFVDRFRAKASKARQAQSRLKALARLETIAPAHVDSGFSFAFRPPTRLPDPMLDLEGVDCGHGETAVLAGVRLNLRPESRIGLIGPNGAGKSTLIRTLAGELPALAGRLQRAPDLVIGYFHQQQVDALPAEASPFELMQRARPNLEEVKVRSELGRFGFVGDDVFAPTGRFSGGEKARLALALLVQARPALLLLDEPANHLDLDMREALTLALQDYEGAVVLVSHDRHLLETTVDELVLVADGRVRPWDGDLDDYARWLRERRQPPESAQEARPETRQPDARTRRQDAARLRERLRPLRRRVEALEQRLEALSGELGELEARLLDDGLYQSGRKDELTALLSRQGELRRERDTVESDLLDAMTELEEAEQAAS